MGKNATDFLLLIHPARLTWNLQATHLERKMIFQTSMIMFHVDLQGCISGTPTPTKISPCHILGSFGSIWNCHHKKVLFPPSFFVTSRTTKTIPKPETKSQSMWSLKTNAFGTLYLKSPWDPPEKNGGVRWVVL